jgi:hypothetical protein
MAVGAVVARILTQYSDKGSKAANKDIVKLGKQFDAFAKKSAKAFGLAAVAVGALAVKLGTDAVKGAMEDQKAQIALATALRNTVNANDAVIASTVKYLDKLELQVGVNNNELIPSLQKFTQATGSVEKAQALQAIALDVSAGTGKSLITVTDGIVRAIGGNIGALKRLGIPLDEAIIKNKDLVGALEVLSKTFGGQAAARAETFEFRMLRLRLSFDQALDSLGYALIPALEEFASVLTTEVLPKIAMWIEMNKKQLAEGLKRASDAAIVLVANAIALSSWISNNMDLVKTMAKLIAGMFVVGRIAAFATVLGKLTAAFVALRTAAGTAAVATAFATGGASIGSAAAALAIVGGAAAITGLKVAGNNARSKKAKLEKGLAGYQGSPGASDIAGLSGFKSQNIKTPTIDANMQALMDSLLKSQNKLNNAKKKELTIEQQIINKMLQKYGLTLMTGEIEAEATAQAIKKNLNRQERLANSPTVSLAAQGDGSASGNSIINSGTPNISVSITTPHGTADDYVVDITNKQNQLAKRAGAINILHRTR